MQCTASACTLKEIKYIDGEKRYKKLLRTQINKYETFDSNKRNSFPIKTALTQINKRNIEIRPRQEVRLEKQISIKTQLSNKVAASIEAIEKKRMEENKRFKFETRKINDNLAKIERKLNTAKDKSEMRTILKIMAAANSSKANGQILNKIGLSTTERMLDSETQYVKKAEKIMKCKELKEKMMQDFKRQKEEELERRQQLRNKSYRQINNKVKEDKCLSRNERLRHTFFQVSLK